MGNCNSRPLPTEKKRQKSFHNSPRRLPPHGPKHHKPIPPTFPFARSNPSTHQSTRLKETQKPVVEAYRTCLNAYNEYASANRVAFEYAKVLQRGRKEGDTSRYVREFVRANRKRERFYDLYTRTYDEYTRVYRQYDGSERARDESKKVADQYKRAREQLVRFRSEQRKLYDDCVRRGAEIDQVAAKSTVASQACNELARTEDRKQFVMAVEEVRRLRDEHGEMLEDWIRARDKCVRVGKRCDQLQNECERLYLETKRVYDAYTWTHNEYNRLQDGGKHTRTYEQARRVDRSMRSYDDYIRLLNAYIKNSPNSLGV